jgi:hypothetical protein
MFFEGFPITIVADVKFMLAQGIFAAKAKTNSSSPALEEATFVTFLAAPVTGVFTRIFILLHACSVQFCALNMFGGHLAGAIYSFTTKEETEKSNMFRECAKEPYLAAFLFCLSQINICPLKGAVFLYEGHQTHLVKSLLHLHN